jgi:cell division protein FtsQ
VSGERKARKIARDAAQGRSRARAARAKPSQNVYRRDRRANDSVRRLLSTFGGWFSFSRPLLGLSAALVVLVLVAALFAGGYIGRTVRNARHSVDAVTDEAGFGIQDIRIAGNSRTPAATIAAALGLERGQSIFNVDLRAARRRLMALDWVADAEVRRRYPDSISVQVVEKIPFALWRSPDGLYVIDRSGGIITSRNLPAFAKFPKLVGPGANHGAEIIDAIAAHRALAARVSVMQRIGDRRWNLVLDDGVTVKLPEKDWQTQLGTLEHLIIDKGVLERDISEIDLRSPTHYFFVQGAPKKDDGGKQI